MEEKNKAVTANIAFRALCGYGARSVGGFLLELNLKMVSSKEKRNRFIEK